MLLATLFTFMEFNCENLYDCKHDSLKDDTEFLPDGARRWTPTRYQEKQTHLAQAILSASVNYVDGATDLSKGKSVKSLQLPDMVAMCEVENDNVMTDLTKHSLLRSAKYKYIVTSSPDKRGIDVALIYSPSSFKPIRHYPIGVTPLPKMKPTRDILYVAGKTHNGDTLHVFVVHAPSRSGGEEVSRPFRMLVAERVAASIDSIRGISPDAKILVAGDFNDYHTNKSLLTLEQHSMTNISKAATGSNGAQATYKYKGEWNSLDHILVSAPLQQTLTRCYVNDTPFLLEEDTKYGGLQPFRIFHGYEYALGYSDHLPLVAQFEF